MFVCYLTAIECTCSVLWTVNTRVLNVMCYCQGCPVGHQYMANYDMPKRLQWFHMWSHLIFPCLVSKVLRGWRHCASLRYASVPPVDHISPLFDYVCPGLLWYWQPFLLVLYSIVNIILAGTSQSISACTSSCFFKWWGIVFKSAVSSDSHTEIA